MDKADQIETITPNECDCEAGVQLVGIDNSNSNLVGVGNIQHCPGVVWLGG